MISFSIIIVTWNALHHLKKFLPSVVKSDYPNFEIILADNASTDESAAWVTKNFPGVIVHSMDKNYGYCGGNNRAAKVAKGDVLIFLNNDVEVSESWLNPLSVMFAESDKIAAIQPKIRSFELRNHFEYAGAAGGFIDYLGYPFCRGRIFDFTEEDRGQYDTTLPIFWASGAALAVRAKDFESTGGFEESFHFHMEEIDLCWRLQQMDKEVWYCHESVVYHLGGGSLPPSDPKKVFYNFRNNLMMLARNLPAKKLVPTLIKRITMDKAAMFRFLFKGEASNFMSVFKALFAFMGKLPEIRRFRKSNNFVRKDLTQFEGVLKKSLVSEHFVREKRYFIEIVE